MFVPIANRLYKWFSAYGKSLFLIIHFNFGDEETNVLYHVISVNRQQTVYSRHLHKIKPFVHL